MRFDPTYSERLLWEAIRGRRLGVEFRRQVILGVYIVDFLSEEAKLVVEVDGDIYHAKRAYADARRERKLIRAGYTVVRLPASLVEKEVERALDIIRVALGTPPLAA